MKKLFTGYFAASKKYPAATLQVRIALKFPRFWSAAKISYQPGLVWRNFLKWRAGLFTGDGKLDYWEQMDEMRARGELQKIIAEIPEGSILMCYEADQCTCHRGWLAEYLTKNGLADITEFRTEPQAKSKITCQSVQADLPLG